MLNFTRGGAPPNGASSALLVGGSRVGCAPGVPSPRDGILFGETPNDASKASQLRSIGGGVGTVALACVTTAEGLLYTSLAVWFRIWPIPIILFSSLFISITSICACGGILVCDISLGAP